MCKLHRATQSTDSRNCGYLFDESGHGGHQCVTIVPIATTVTTEKSREIWGVSGLSLMDDAVEVALKLHVPLQLSLFGDFGLLENRFVQKSTFSRKISVVTVDKKMYDFPGKKARLQRKQLQRRI